jgi:hypothetical protein
MITEWREVAQLTSRSKPLHPGSITSDEKIESPGQSGSEADLAHGERLR